MNNKSAFLFLIGRVIGNSRLHRNLLRRRFSTEDRLNRRLIKMEIEAGDFKTGASHGTSINRLVDFLKRNKLPSTKVDGITYATPVTAGQFPGQTSATAAGRNKHPASGRVPPRRRRGIPRPG